MKTNFRPAYIKDFAACWKVIDQARQSMIESGRHQWTEEYPSEKDIRKDIENGNAFVLTVNEEETKKSFSITKKALPKN